MRKKENNENCYELTTLCAMITSFERFMRKKNYGFSMTKDVAFERTVLKSIQTDLKKKGKGRKPNALVSLTKEEQLNLLYDMEL